MKGQLAQGGCLSPWPASQASPCPKAVSHKLEALMVSRTVEWMKASWQESKPVQCSQHDPTVGQPSNDFGGARANLRPHG